MCVILISLKFLWRRNYNFLQVCPDIYLQCKSVYLVCWVRISSLRARNLPKLTAASTIGLAHLVRAAQGGRVLDQGYTWMPFLRSRFVNLKDPPWGPLANCHACDWLNLFMKEKKQPKIVIKCFVVRPFSNEKKKTIDFQSLCKIMFICFLTNSDRNQNVRL